MENERHGGKNRRENKRDREEELDRKRAQPQDTASVGGRGGRTPGKHSLKLCSLGSRNAAPSPTPP